MSHSISIDYSVGNANADQCLYAAAFLVPGILDVKLDGNTWTFVTEYAVDSQLLERRLATIVARYTTANGHSEVLMDC